MMNYDEFKESVSEQIRDVLPEKYRDADVEIRPVDKINKRYEALFVKPFGENQSVAVNLEELYEQYAAGIMDFEDTLSAMSAMIQDGPQVAIDLEEVRNYEMAKERLFIRVCGAEQNEELLKNIPHRNEEDLAVTYHLLINKSGDGTVGSVIITNEHLKAFGISEEQLHQDALENSPKILPPTLMPMQDIMENIYLEEMLGFGMPEEMAQMMAKTMMPEVEVPMYVLTNEQKVNGAGVIFYPEMMDKIGDTLGHDLIILPSSTHEVIILPDEGNMTALETQEMVTEVNSEWVRPEELLSDGAYHYDREAHAFEKFSSYEARMEEKEAALNMEATQEAEKPLDGVISEEPVRMEKEEGQIAPEGSEHFEKQAEQTVSEEPAQSEKQVNQAVSEKPAHSEMQAERTAPAESIHTEKRVQKQAVRSGKGTPSPKRESVLKKLEAKKAAAKERESGKSKERTRSTHQRDDAAIA
ncbi:MAG: DUF5688 family protein [Clostridiales bacterium]|nr:DUF5688 family protein [Clostridiales bacterium]